MSDFHLHHQYIGLSRRRKYCQWYLRIGRVHGISSIAAFWALLREPLKELLLLLESHFENYLIAESYIGISVSLIGIRFFVMNHVYDDLENIVHVFLFFILYRNLKVALWFSGWIERCRYILMNASSVFDSEALL